MIECIVSSDGINFDSKIFSTVPGQSINIFVLNDAWREIAETLASIYPPSH